MTAKVSPFLAVLMQDYTTVWCPIHLMPYQAQWPLGAPAATMFLVYAAADLVGDEGYRQMCSLVEAAPLCCYLGKRDRSALRGIYGKTVPL